MRQFRQALLLAAVWCLVVASTHAETPANPVIGKWKHASGKITLEIERNRLHIIADQPGNEDLLSLHADYGVTRDLTVYGLFTRVEGKKSSLLDKPFSFRVRVEEGCLVIRDTYCGSHVEGFCNLDFLHGVYRNTATPIANKTGPKAEQSPPSVPAPAPSSYSVVPPGFVPPSMSYADDSENCSRVPSSKVLVPSIPTSVPSCRLLGDRLENFALKDIDGKVWEYRNNRQGRLLLLSFWYHNCAPCIAEIPQLMALQNEFSPSALQVVSIACETGSLNEQCQKVRAIRNRYHINYALLLSGGGPGHCPVMEQFQATSFPLLVLIDGDGTILWRSSKEGMDDAAHEKLRKMIRDTLTPKAQKEAH